MVSTLSVKVEFISSGLGKLSKSLLYSGWADSELCRSRTFGEWYDELVETFENTPHIQVNVEDENGYVVGTVMLADTLDAQVGFSMIAYHQFMIPEYRGGTIWRRVFRMCENVALAIDHKWFIWTHLKRNGRIVHTYKEI